MALLLSLGFGLFASAGHDDSHITYWVAWKLRETGQLVNYNGERVEQSSSLAHVLVLALLALLTRIDIPTLGPVTSIGAALLTLVATRAAIRRAAPKAPPGGELLVASNASFVYWAFGGLETPLFAATSLGLVLALHRSLEARRPAWVALGASSLAFVATRPEAPLVLGCALLPLGLFAWRTGRGRAWLSSSALALAPALLLFGFRRAYFSAWFPNPVYTKATGIDASGGFRYLAQHLYPGGLLLGLFALIGLGFAAVRATQAKAPPALVAAASLTVSYLGFVVLTGGDWMTGGRFVAHLVPLLAVLAWVGLAELPRPRLVPWLAAASVALAVFGVLLLANGPSTGRPLWTTRKLRPGVEARVGPRGYGFFELSNRVHLRDTLIAAKLVDWIGALREAHPGRRFELMASQAGMVPYYAFREHEDVLHFVDMCSLTTREPRACLAASELDRRKVGLQLHFDRYFARRSAIDEKCGTRRPDLVFGLGQRGIEAVLERNGYAIVFRQKGPIRSEGLGPWFRAPLASDQFIAIDRALLAGVAREPEPVFDWDI